MRSGNGFIPRNPEGKGITADQTHWGATESRVSNRFECLAMKRQGLFQVLP